MGKNDNFKIINFNWIFRKIHINESVEIQKRGRNQIKPVVEKYNTSKTLIYKSDQINSYNTSLKKKKKKKKRKKGKKKIKK